MFDLREHRASDTRVCNQYEYTHTIEVRIYIGRHYAYTPRIIWRNQSQPSTIVINNLAKENPWGMGIWRAI